MSKKDTRLDPRVVRTRKLLRSALVSLITEKGFRSITVQDITDKATLNRATFYLHYGDKIELLNEAFEELMANAIPMPPEKGISPLQAAQDSITFLFDHIAINADFFRVMLGEENVPEFTARIHEYIQTVGLQWFSALQPEEKKILVSPDIAINFLGSAYQGVIVWWLQNGMPYPADYMAAQLLRLTTLGLQRSLGLQVPEDL
jgi:AcrR family transcriptional regulator